VQNRANTDIVGPEGGERMTYAIVIAVPWCIVPLERDGLSRPTTIEQIHRVHTIIELEREAIFGIVHVHTIFDHRQDEKDQNGSCEYHDFDVNFNLSDDD
jgi:hypothetical protein